MVLQTASNMQVVQKVRGVIKLTLTPSSISVLISEVKECISFHWMSYFSVAKQAPSAISQSVTEAKSASSTLRLIAPSQNEPPSTFLFLDRGG